MGREPLNAESTFNPSLLRKNLDRSSVNESVFTKDNTSDINFEKPTLAKQFIQPYNSQNMVTKLLRESVGKFQFSKPSLIGQQLQQLENKENLTQNTYQMLLKQKPKPTSKAFASFYIPTSKPDLHPLTNQLEQRLLIQAFLEKEAFAKDDFIRNKKEFTRQIQQKFFDHQSSDHAMLEYLMDLWSTLEVSYQVRVQFLSFLMQSSVQQAYQALEESTLALTQTKNLVGEVLQVIKKKELEFGNLFDEEKFEKRSQESTLFQLRQRIIRLCEQAHKKQK